MSELVKLKKVMQKYGYAYIAYKLGYRDTTAIKKWISRNKIPLSKLQNVRKFLSKMVF